MNIKVLGAVALLALTGCSSSDDIDTVPDNSKDQTEDVAIGFSSYLGNAVNTRAMGTRADEETYTGGEIDDATLAKVGFGVFAYYTGTEKYSTAKTTPTPNFMYNTDVTKSGDNWIYTPVRYWPNPTRVNGTSTDQYVSFFAYAPHVSSVTSGYGITDMSINSYAGNPTVTYTAKANSNGKYVDLLWSSSDTKDKTKDKYENTTVTFNFKHALAKIPSSISIQLDPEDNIFNNNETRVTVSSIKITGKSNAAESGTLDLATGTWSGQKYNTDSPVSIEYSSSDFKATDNSYNFGEPTSMTGMATKDDNGKDIWATSMPTGLTTTAIKLNSVTPMLVIPSSSAKYTVEITYTVRTLDSSLKKGYTEVTQTVSSDDLSLGTAMNSQYGLTIKVGLNTVKFDASVSAWDDETSSSVSLPEKLTSTTSTSGN